jgi:hypothetical protein
MTALTPHKVLMEHAKRVKEGGGRIKHDKESGVLDAYDVVGKPCIKAIQKGGPKAPWIATFTDTDAFQWKYSEATT